MNNVKLLYRTYEKNEADNIIAILEGNSISYKMNSANSNIEPILGSASSSQYELYVTEDSYSQAIDLIGAIYQEVDTEINLSTYSDEEIKEVLLNQHDWHASFISSAKQIAQQRNIITDYSNSNTTEKKHNKGDDIEVISMEANKQARITLFIIAGLNVIIPIILIGPGDGVKILNLLFYITGASVYSILGLMAKRRPLTASTIGLCLLLTVYYFTYLGDPSMITRYVFLKISLVAGLGYAILKEIQLRSSR